MSAPPLNLFQVLEEEYERLHGKPAPSLDRSDPGNPSAPTDSEIRLRNVIKDIHQSQHSAICLSGGGIRSATFGLGVLQGLARHKLMDKFSYLSTVSGGGYVGGWLSAWIHRHPKGLAGVVQELPSEKPQFLLNPEPEPITHLRSYSNYLTPRLGLLSADTWTLVAIIARNLILNWLVLIPLMVAALALPRLFVAVAQLAPPNYVRWSALGLAFVFGAWMIAYVGIKRPSIAKKHCDQDEFLKFCLLPLLLSSTLLAWYWAWVSQATDLDLGERVFVSWHPAVRFVVFGLVLHLAGWLTYSFLLSRFKERATWMELFALAINGVVGGVLLWLVVTKTFLHVTSGQLSANRGFQVYALLLYAALAVPIYLILVLLALTLFVGVSSRWTEDEDREWWARFGGWVLIVVIVWALASLLVLVGPGLMTYLWAKYVMPAGGLIGLVTALLGRSAKSPAKDKQGAKAGLLASITPHILPLGAVIFAGVLVVFLSLGTNYLLDLIATLLSWLLPHFSFSTNWLHNQTFGLDGSTSLLGQTELTTVGSRLIFASSRQLLILIGLMFGLGIFMAYLINTNKFSHHAMYRNRLIRAYLGASRRNSDRDPDPFTGFDPEDNLPMQELRPELLHSSSFGNFDSLVNKLRAPSDPTSTHIVSALLSPKSKRLLRIYKPKGGADNSRKLLQQALIKDLNKALSQTSALFTQEILQTPEPPTGDALVRYNRRLLEKAYRDEILPCPESPHLPLHVVNMTLNLVHGDRLAWQQRKAESFTVTPLHCGSFQIPDTEDRTPPTYGSYRRTQEYGGQDHGGISLGTAVAISGAAVSPNMGYYSSPVVTFLMTLFNVRLGWWLGNPGPKGEDYYRLAYPKSAVYPVIAEALGRTDDRNSYVYLSDGGHFENLGLYEMVLRRCRLVVISDASDDAEFQFDNLGNAVLKVRTDFRIPIDFQPMQIFPRRDKKKGAYCAIGTIRYSCVDEVDKVDDHGNRILHTNGKPVQVPAPDGTIIYIKPVFYGDEPRDIYHYAMTHDTFPHESTADQWFSEEQFESYRMLGSHIIESICTGTSGGTISEVVLVDPVLSGFLMQAQQRALNE